MNIEELRELLSYAKHMKICNKVSAYYAKRDLKRVNKRSVKVLRVDDLLSLTSLYNLISFTRFLGFDVKIVVKEDCVLVYVPYSSLLLYQKYGRICEEVKAREPPEDVRKFLLKFVKRKSVQASEEPVCIVQIREKALRGVHLSHPERLALATYELWRRFLEGKEREEAVQEVKRYFERQEDYDERKTVYYLRRLAGEGGKTYFPPSCAWMESNGLCVKCGKKQMNRFIAKCKSLLSSPNNSQSEQ